MQYKFDDENFLSNSFNEICSQKCLDYLEWVYKIKEEDDSRVNENDIKNAGHDIYFFIKEYFPNELKSYINNLTFNSNMNLEISGSSQNSGNHSVVPYIKFVDKNNENFYVSYLVKSDMSGFFLTLILETRNHSNSDLQVLKDKFKNNLLKLFNLNDSFFTENMSFDEINLKCEEEWGNKDNIPKRSKCNLPKQYETGNILSIEYEKDFLDEATLKEDLSYMLNLYGFLIDYHFGDILGDLEEESINTFFIHKNIFEKNFINNLSDNAITEFKDNFFTFIQNLMPPKNSANLNIDVNFNLKKSTHNPSINIYYNNVSNDFNKGLYIFSKFNLNDNSINIGFSLKDSNFELEIIKSTIKYLFNFIKNNLDLEKLNVDDESLNLELYSDEIIFYSIKSDMLSPNKLNDIYKNIIRIYDEIIPIYICFIFKNEIMGQIESFDHYETINMDFIKLTELFNGFKIDSTILNDLCSFLNTDNIILRGVPGTGKTHIANILAKLGFNENFNNGYIMTTATSDWSTFDTIGGLMPDEDGKLFFNPGIFLEAIKHNKWLIIDEINRADIDKAFGQLFTVLSGHDVQLPFKINNHYIQLKKWEKKECFFDGNFTYFIGTNWRIIGTMNTMDKDTLFDLSYAFMRRFRFIDIEIPKKSDYLELMDNWSGDLESKYVNELYEFNSVRDLGPAIFKDMFYYINNRISHDESEKESKIKPVISNAIISCIIPQLEGISNSEELNNILKIYFEEEKLKKLIDTITIDL